MKLRTNIYLEKSDREMIEWLRQKFGLDCNAATVRFLVRKAAKEEGYQNDCEKESSDQR
jgi:hypothetical protein